MAYKRNNFNFNNSPINSTNGNGKIHSIIIHCLTTMKAISAFTCCVSLLIISCAKSQELDDAERSCMTKLNVDDFLVDYNLNQLYMPEDNPSFSKFMGCVWKKKGFIDSKNNLQFDIFTDYIAQRFVDVVGNTKSANALAKDSVNSCMIVKGDTAGQTGIMFMNCVTRLFQA